MPIIYINEMREFTWFFTIGDHHTPSSIWYLFKLFR